MADNDYKPGSMDISDQRATYDSAMKFGTRYGLPFSLALAAFFTFLLINFGIIGSAVMFAIVFVAVHLIVKTFFAH